VRPSLRGVRDKWWWGAPGATLAGFFVFAMWVAYGGGDADSGNRPLIRGAGLIAWLLVTWVYVERASRR
jgi:hypothetical protein